METSSGILGPLVDKKLLAKARKRIKKFIETGEHQPRVRTVENQPSLFRYWVKHHLQSIVFKLSKDNRLILQK